MVMQILLTQEYRGAGYTDHFDAHDNEAVLKVPCVICSGKCIYIGLKMVLPFEDYKAISRCTRCGNEYEF